MPRKIDLTGRRFGRLSILSCTEKRDGSAVVWRCKCDCGNIVDVSARNLLHRGTVSCGCNRREKSVSNIAGDIAAKLGQVEHTNVSRLKSDKPQANNKSGYRGVSWHPFPHGGGRWVAVIYFKGKRYRLGFFDASQDASKAYLTAKEHIHGDFIRWYTENKKEWE